MSFRQHALSVSLILKLSHPFILLRAAQSPNRPARPDEIIRRLARLDSFAFGRVGWGPGTSQGETDYRRILSRPSAAADFETLFAIGNPQAKCYALVGFRQMSPGRFQSLAKILQFSQTQVMVTRGCVTSPYSMAEIVARIRSGFYSGPMTSDFIPPVGVAQTRAASNEDHWMNRLMRLFSPAPLPDRPPVPPAPPPPARPVSH